MDGWPPNFNGRAISSQVMDEYRAGVSLDERIAKLEESGRNGEDSRLIVWAGVGVELTNEIKEAAMSYVSCTKERLYTCSTPNSFWPENDDLTVLRLRTN
ncbi:hypothetical protein B0H19DRAFT_195918 [Mycena capillaripes]|nr:hypothetical protein B0H19DRAFT_195918 [Mycena capillaripes]